VHERATIALTRVGESKIGSTMNLGMTYSAGPDGTRVMSLTPETRDWVISFVRENARRSPLEIEEIVHLGQRELMTAIDGVSEAQAAHKPGVDDWSILELLAHEISVRRTIITLANAMRHGGLPPGFGPHFEEAKAQDGFIGTHLDTLAEARDAADAAHDAIVTFVRGIDGSMNTELTFRHYYFGAFNAVEWVVFLRVHDGDHTAHIAKIKTSPGYPAA
jgi:hypothetical protein